MFHTWIALAMLAVVIVGVMVIGKDDDFWEQRDE